LVDYLQSKGYKTGPGLVECFNPSHPHTGKRTPQLSVYFDKDKGKQIFHCFSGSCGIGGDVYEAVNILEGIAEPKEQFLFLEKFFGAGWRPTPARPAEAKARESFTPDPIAQAELEKHLSENPAAEKEIIKFLNARAVHSTKGMIKTYPENILPELLRHFFYWPGLGAIKKKISQDILERVGITHPEKKYFWWEHSGIILKLGNGYKLHYYSDGKCNKFNTRGGFTFPMPGKIDTSKRVIVVEGEMDAVSSRAIGLENVYSAGGTNGITAPMIKELLLDAPEIIICFDADDAGRKASGIIPFEIDDKNKENLPKKIIRAGFTGEIKIAELPIGIEERDQDALIIAGKRDILFDAIRNAKKYSLAENGPEKEKTGERRGDKWDFLTPRRMRSILKKITRKMIEEKNKEDVQVFVSAIIKAASEFDAIENDLKKWGAVKDEIENKNAVSPYILVEFAWQYGLSKYMQREIKIELTPASELFKRINHHKPIVDIDYEDMRQNKNLIQFFDTKGTRSAALLVSDVLDGRVVFVESEKKYYFYNGHTWQREPDMTGVIYNIVIAIMTWFYEKVDMAKYSSDKGTVDEIVNKMEGRKFRLDVLSEFSQLEQFEVFKTSVLFDGPSVKETLTLIDGVIDFSGKKIIYRKSKREEYRRSILPYTVEQFKRNINPEKFIKFMRGNFKNDLTLQSLMYYMSLISSRNTQNKYGGIFIGETNTGKTTTLEIIKAIYPGMIESMPSEILVTKGTHRSSGNEATPYISRLEGKGAGVSSETNRNLHLNSALWKLLTGGDTLTARDLYQSPHDFTPTAQIIILTNHPPLFDNHDQATINRMVIIPFLTEHKRGEESTVLLDDIIESLRDEFPAIIKLLAEYYIKLKYEHLNLIPLSDECKRYKQRYIDEQDTDIDKFVKERIKFEMSEDNYAPVKEVYNAYLRYWQFTSADSGKEALTQNKFTRYFKRDYMEVIHKQKKINGEPVLCFFNIKLRPDKETRDPGMEIEPEKPGTNIGGTATMPPPDDDPFK
jgi:P4 family phage/plasmid primase-like protien